MFYHRKHLQYEARPDQPNPLLAKRIQELIGGPMGEMTVAMQYLFQGWNCRGPAKYRDMLLDIGTEELAHIEMLATMVGRLLDGAPVSVQESAAINPVVAAVMGGSSPKHAIVSGLGALPSDSAGVPWSGNYTIASGNLLADFRSNLHAESQGRLQAIRVYESTDDAGVKKMLGYNIARDTMHQNQWLAAIEQLREDGLEDVTCPSAFPMEELDADHREAAYQYWGMSEGNESSKGRWASGPSMDGKGTFTYLEMPGPQGGVPEMPAGDPKLFNTPGSGVEGRKPGMGASATNTGGTMGRMAESLKDKLSGG